MTSECVLKKLCIFIIVHIKEYLVKYVVVTNNDLFESPFQIHQIQSSFKMQCYNKIMIMIELG